jgi:hypothetical protein
MKRKGGLGQVTHGDHRLGYLEEACDVCANYVVAWLTKVPQGP